MSDKDSVVTVDELDETAEELRADPGVEEGHGGGGGGGGNMDHDHQGGQRWRSGGADRGSWGGGYGARRGGYQSGGPTFDGGELGSKILHIQSKKFYVDLKESRRGRFVKISEVALNGNKNRMTMELKSAVELHEKLTDFIAEYSKLGPRSSSSSDGRQQRLKSETIFATERRYYLDLKENRMGRFLKIAMTMPPPNFDRCEIVIPAQGMVDLRDAIVDLINEFGGDEVKKELGDKGQASDGGKEEGGLSMKSSGKTIHLTVSRNSHGTHLKISEVCPTFRTAINVPYEYWGRFLEILKKNAASGSNGVESASQTKVCDDVD